MPRSRHIVTGEWVEINKGRACVITFDGISVKGHVDFNEIPDESDTLLRVHARPNDQIEQNEDKSVFVRSDQTGYQIVVDVKGNA